MAALAGFFSVDGSKALGGRCDPTTEISALDQLKNVGIFTPIDTVPMQWGRAHDVSSLPTSITSGLTPMQLRHLPPMGASPDAMLIGLDADGKELKMPVECKAPCPFKHNTGPGQDAAEWTYVETGGEWSTMPAHHYAQC